MPPDYSVDGFGHLFSGRLAEVSTIRKRREIPAATPLRRATSVTFAPGAKVSSTIRALSSCDKRRRRSNPSKTSTRIA
jgi:hypothetical protein